MVTEYEQKWSRDWQDLSLPPENLYSAMQELLEFSGSLLQIISQLAARLLLVDRQGQILAATGDCLRQVLRRERQQVLDQPLALVLAELWPVDDNLLALQRAVLAGQDWRGLLELAGGQTWRVQVRAYGQATLLFFDPLNDDCQLEEEQQQGLLRQGRLAGSVLHDIKNYLQNISGAVSLLQFKCQDHPDWQRHLNTIKLALNSTEQLTRGFLGLSKTAVQVGECSLNSVIREILPLCQASLQQARVELRLALDPNLPRQWLDKNGIKQVILNCLDNAVEAILEKRQQPAPAGAEEGWVEISTCWEAAERQVVLRFQDNGVGLNEEQLAGFFRPYYTSKPQGTGLGASICRNIIQRHGGVMQAAGQPGAGCCVTVFLPQNTAIEPVANGIL